MKKLVVFSLFAIASVQSFAQTKEDIKMFPKAEKDENQKVIRLDPKENEEDYMVEILIGKKITTDGCNNYFLSGKLEENNLDGWGYNYYNFETDGNIASTLMGCMNAKSVEKVVYASSEKVRYNSKLPIVIYAPKGYEVNYKIWSAATEIKSAE